MAPNAKKTRRLGRVFLDRAPQGLEHPLPFFVVMFQECRPKAGMVTMEPGQGDDDNSGRSHQVIDEPLVSRDPCDLGFDPFPDLPVFNGQ